MIKGRGFIPAVFLVGGLSTAALAGVVSASLRPGLVTGGNLSLDAWRRLFADDSFIDAFWFTARSSITATIVAVVLAVPLGYSLRRSASWVRAAVAVPIPVPHLVVAVLAVVWFGQGGLLDRIGPDSGLIGDRFGLGLVIVYVFKEVPFLAILVVASLDRRVDLLVQAAQALGANRWRCWLHIILPRLAKPLGAGVGVVAAFVVGNTEVPQIVGPAAPDSLTTYALTVTNLGGPAARADAAAALVVISLAILALVAVSLWLIRSVRLFQPGQTL